MSIQEERLIDWGYLRPGRSFQDAVASYQAAYGLKSDGILASLTQDEMDGRFCNCSDHPDDELSPGANRYEANWPVTCRGEIDVSWNFSFPGTSREETEESWDVLQDYEDLGLQAFSYGKNGKEFKMSYYQAPEEAMDDAELLGTWASNAYGAAMRAAAKKGGKRKKQ